MGPSSCAVSVSRAGPLQHCVGMDRRAVIRCICRGMGSTCCLIFAIPGVNGKSPGSESADIASGYDILSTSSKLPGPVSSHGKQGHCLDDF